MSRCLFLELLPAELRVEIYELALRLDPPVIVIDFRPPQNETQPNNPKIPSALLQTSQQIHAETCPILYNINSVHIHAPIFTPRPSDEHPSDRSLIISRLQRIATQQLRTHHLSHAKLFLGRMYSVGRIRWMDFFTRWIAVLPAIRALREGVEGSVEVEFESLLGKGGRVCVGFDVKTREGVERGLMGEGGEVEMSELERERLGRIRRTVVKTLFEGDGDGEAA
ncbi:hypothetical protein M409DRAFT_24385 [Zasmidium cellare ATCC 36951]|uniref:Uncharacterized protein n=1 Tax=Zasmidium cellare ATCC 36951 TaxID=1080233 RepID=A0A6A6CHV3_ZASCE|nr:uncharacterized protein M409DRAFT_24385 [Zasmidium cellare ATCC 36951]KAF2165532.1 hypothetical protein M409DRAFT_24385 [Zasmidium cellare ATCC 36951]